MVAGALLDDGAHPQLLCRFQAKECVPQRPSSHLSGQSVFAFPLGLPFFLREQVHLHMESALFTHDNSDPRRPDKHTYDMCKLFVHVGR